MLATVKLISHPLPHKAYFSFLFFETRVLETCLLHKAVRPTCCILGPCALPTPPNWTLVFLAPLLPQQWPPPHSALYTRAWLDSTEKWDHAVLVSWLISLSAIPSRPVLGVFFTLVLLMLVTGSCPTLCDPMGYSVPGSYVRGILQAGILEWVAIPFSRGSSPPRAQTRVSCIAGRFFTVWAISSTHVVPDGRISF